MNTSISIRALAGLALSAIIFAACGGAAAPAPTAVPATAKPAAAAVVLELGTKGDELAFDKTTLSAPAGSKITIRFNNKAGAGSGMLHNVVVLKAGASIDGVAADGIAAGEANGYVKPNDTRVLAHSKLIKGGENLDLTFDAPAPGDYIVTCTFPGHYVLMKLTLTIK
ncbi:MAG TPA: plastocyanin/azurin family copper-binding protein [Thermoflexales bacterium]|jgi:azurin|nr:plastocyanin/azurin family copper-binding protein [Thermoflexales bacterium]HQZ54594.1 plastocyanin/azurin family copper-binding protein [Thermoflexales bacterium]